MTRDDTYVVPLTFEEIGNLVIASGRGDVSAFTTPARSALRRGQAKLRLALPEDLRLELAHAEQKEGISHD